MNKINLVSDTINKDDIAKLVDWLSQEEIPRLTKGNITVEFENKWSAFLNTRYTTYVNSGSSAILLALAALKEKGLKNDKVVAPTLSWLTDVSSIMQLGMKPILCDCNLHDLSLDLDNLEKIFIEEKPSIVILVSVLGLVPDMKRVVELCNKYDVILLEDVCESMGSKYENRYLGTFGKISVFSLYYGHHLSTIEGGLVCTDDEELSYIVSSMRSHGWDRDWPEQIQKKYREKYKIDEFDSLYTFYYPGFNFRSTDLQAYIGLTQIDKLEDFSQKRNINFKTYFHNLKNNMLIINERENDFISNFAYPYVSENRNKIVDKLRKSNIEVRPLIAGSMAKKPFWFNKYGNISFKNADLIDKYGFYIPNHQGMTQEQIKYICEIINQF
jgi:CDP-6-deoxy-D-xylo-4-hexulose-3-dehydrase